MNTSLTKNGFKAIALFLLCSLIQPILATKQNQVIHYPNLNNFVTLSADLHTHSVFSDGKVWPSIRVQEALKDNLDIIAITEHLEYQPHISDLPHPDRNRAYQVAQDANKSKQVIVINGAEITRDMPPGHLNAIFLDDANTLLNIQNPNKEISQKIDPIKYYEQLVKWPVEKALQAAKKQHAFVFWNHPSWSYHQADGITRLSPLHKKLINKKLIHGIEIVNGNNYSKEAFQLALTYNLTIIGSSDVHRLIHWDYPPHTHKHRPITLIFSKDKTKAEIKKALFNGQTAVVSNAFIFGKKYWLSKLIQKSITFSSKGYTNSHSKKTKLLHITITNHSSQKFELQNTSAYKLAVDLPILLEPYQTVSIYVSKPKKSKKIRLSFNVNNAFVGPNKTLMLDTTLATHTP